MIRKGSVRPRAGQGQTAGQPKHKKKAKEQRKSKNNAQVNPDHRTRRRRAGSRLITGDGALLRGGAAITEDKTARNVAVFEVLELFRMALVLELPIELFHHELEDGGPPESLHLLC